MWDMTSTSRIYSGWFWLPDHTDEQMTAALSWGFPGAWFSGMTGPHLEGKGSTSTKWKWVFFSGSGQIVYENIWNVLVWRMVISPENIENTALLFIIFHMNSHKSGYHCDTSPNINWQTNWSHQPQYIRRKSIWILLLETILCKSISSLYFPCIFPLISLCIYKSLFLAQGFQDFLPVFLWHKVLGASPSKRKPRVLRAVVPAVRWIDTWQFKGYRHKDWRWFEGSGAQNM